MTSEEQGPTGQTLRSSRPGRVSAHAFAAVALIALSTSAWFLPGITERVRAERRTSVAAPHCVGGRWTEAEVVTDLPAGTFLRSPTLAVSARELYLAGSPSPAGPSAEGIAPNAATPLVQQARRGTIGLPEGPFHFLNARLLRGRGGRLHLVWGEARASKASQLMTLAVPPSKAGSLWYATFVPGSGWNAASEIRSARGPRDDLLWNSESSDASVSLAGRIDLVVPRVDSGLLHLSFEGSRWREETLPVRALYATIAQTRSGTLHLAYLGEDPKDRGPMSRIMLLSMAEGSRWSAPRGIGRRDTRGATRPRLLSAPDGTLHLLWGISSSGRLGSAWLRHLSSDDGGEHWSAAHDLELPHEPFTKWRAGVDRCGAPRLLVSMWTTTDAGPSGRVLHSVLRDSSWAPLAPVLGERGPREIDVESGPGGELYVVASLRLPASRAARPSYQVAVSTFVESATSAPTTSARP